jgi:hypothetical protein
MVRMKGALSSIQVGAHDHAIGYGDRLAKHRFGWPLKSSPDRPLILYAYFETPNARANIQYFITHGLHGAADFIFILNGETDIYKQLPKKSNIKFVQRRNDCFDLGSYGEVLLKDELYKKYNHFIMLNASIRGPFLPYWSEACWSDMFLRRITDEVKVCRCI